MQTTLMGNTKRFFCLEFAISKTPILFTEASFRVPLVF